MMLLKCAMECTKPSPLDRYTAAELSQELRKIQLVESQSKSFK